MSKTIWGQGFGAHVVAKIEKMRAGEIVERTKKRKINK